MFSYLIHHEILCCVGCGMWDAPYNFNGECPPSLHVCQNHAATDATHALHDGWYSITNMVTLQKHLFLQGKLLRIARTMREGSHAAL